MFRLHRVVLALFLLPVLGACEFFAVEPTSMSPRIVEEDDWGEELPPGELALEKVTDPALWPDFGAGFGEKESLLRAIDGTLEYFAKPSSEQWFPYLDIDHARSKRSLEVFRDLLVAANSPEELNQAIRANFEVYRSKGLKSRRTGAYTGRVFYTGYHTPIYDARTQPEGEFQHPLYGRPPELVSDPITGEPQGWNSGSGVGPSPTRAEFDAGLLKGRGLEMYYVKSKLDAYVIHVQGSAKLRLPNGELHTIGYSGKTERPYVGLGSTMVEAGKIGKGELSLFKIREYFQRNPAELDEYVNKNESYVFFTRAEGGPFGSMNIPVTAHRSLATDKKVFPRGGITFVQTTAPHPAGGNDYQQFMIDQDTGGAIRSASRGDIYMGVGEEAEHHAGGTGAEGKLWYIYAK
jgi:membrane-bound lytic murein transglycosylase A